MVGPYAIAYRRVLRSTRIRLSTRSRKQATENLESHHDLSIDDPTLREYHYLPSKVNLLPQVNTHGNFPQQVNPPAQPPSEVNFSSEVNIRPPEGYDPHLLQVMSLPLVYRGISLIRNSPPLGPYSRTKPRALW